MKPRRGLWRISISALIIALLLMSSNGLLAYTIQADDEPVHEYISEQALDVYNQYYGSDAGSASLNDWFYRIRDGAGNEDLRDHVYDHSGAFLTISHFWDADNGLGDPVDHIVIGENGANAWQKAEALWSMALGEYAVGDYHEAYEYLGHVAHLLSDMSVPAHAHEDIHAGYDSYEEWMILANATLNETEKLRLLGAGPVPIPEDLAVDPLFYLFYTTNQVGDFFSSDDYSGDAAGGALNDYYSAWLPGIMADFCGLSVPQVPLEQVTTPRTQHDLDDNYGDYTVNNDDFDLSTIRNYSYCYAIRAVAALYKLFADLTSSHGYLTLIIDEIDAQDPHEEPSWGADFYVDVCIDGTWIRNEGNQYVDMDHWYPHWGFGKVVGFDPGKSVPIVIRLWDEDETAVIWDVNINNDDPSDIDPVEDQQDLDISVSLATGAITGDANGTCGAPLQSMGDPDAQDVSRIVIRVLLPNMPPVAHAGDDQTVDEGDLVNLNGTYEDPNAEDTHTFLWHLQSSTNGQAIPDAATQNMSFTPQDNGIYTFQFTVTDNWGATGSDEVVVTANNVNPLTQIDSLTDETGAAIGSEVPVALVGLAIDLGGSFTDAGTADTHTAALLWGDGPADASFATFTDSTGGVTGQLSDTHIFAVPGQYTITLTITDDDLGVGTATTPIEVVDAAGAIACVIESLTPLADDKIIQNAIDCLQGEYYDAAISWSGALDLLELDQPFAAMQRIKQAMIYLEAAEAAEVSYDLHLIKGLLALAAKSITVGLIADAESVAVKAKDWQKIQNAYSLVAAGDELLANQEYVKTIEKYLSAVQLVIGIK